MIKSKKMSKKKLGLRCAKLISRFGLAWYSLVWLCIVWHGLVGSGFGKDWFGMVLYTCKAELSSFTTIPGGWVGVGGGNRN